MSLPAYQLVFEPGNGRLRPTMRFRWHCAAFGREPTLEQAFVTDDGQLAIWKAVEVVPYDSPMAENIYG